MSPDLQGQVAVVTGAGGGVGGAISLSLAAAGVTVWLVGRSRERLATVMRLATGLPGTCIVRPTDVTTASEIDRLREDVLHECGGVDVLIHCAGVISVGRVGEADLDEMDRQYAVNVRAPYAVTRAFLPDLKVRPGQVVFINSSAGLTARAGIGQYAATKHGLRAVADSLREELNPEGVRVLSVFLGRTASPMQAEVHRAESRPYRPDLLMQPTDIAAIVVSALALPRTAEVTEITMRPMRKVG